MNSLLSLSELFNNVIFRIPDYQRGYAWNDQQLEDFWEDLNNLTDTRDHYMGMLSLKELKEGSIEKLEGEKWIVEQKKYKAYHIVDGQQRLTTFIILLSCILDFSESKGINYLNSESLEQISSRYIVEYKLPEKILKAYKFGYEADNPSFDYLRFKILKEDASGYLHETFYTYNLEKAKAFFNKQLKNYYEKNGGNWLETFFNKLVNNLKFNIHNINDDFDVFVAFETMNNRGKKLSNLEILKNRLIYLITIYDESVIDTETKNQLRKEINEAWKEVYFQLGRNKNHLLNDDEYLKNHWTLFFKYSRNRGDDYIKFLLGQHFTARAVYGLERTIVLDEELDEEQDDIDLKVEEIEEVMTDKLLPVQIKDYVNSLKKVSQFWYYSYNPEQADFMNEEEIKWINKLNRIGINYFRTLVVASFLNEKVNYMERIELFKAIEKTIFVFFRMAQYNSTWRSAFAYKRARELMKAEIKIVDIIDDLNENFERNKAEAVSTFVSRITSLFKNNEGYYSWKSRWYFLFEYEMSLSENTYVSRLNDWSAFTRNVRDQISIEHIFPQNTSVLYWQDQFRGFLEKKHYLTNSIGNLLALSQSVNSSLQNYSFEDKKEGRGRGRGYKNGSHSEIEVANKYCDWTPYTIKERGLNLLSFMEKRWDFEFENNDVKLKALGLDFMKD